MSLAAYTVIHVIISLIGIASGLVVLYGLLKSKRLDGWTGLFLTTTVLTTVTGFGFPFAGVTPAIRLGIISLVVLAVAIVARYPMHMSGAWRKTYVISACIALYLNVFVLIVQSFEKVPTLKAAAPTQKKLPFAGAQLTVLIVFAVLTYLAAKRFRVEPMVVARLARKAA